MALFKHIERCPKQHVKALEEAHVAIVGAGGLGSNIAMLLIRAGVGTLSIYDFDCVEIHNLNRQHYTLKHVGMPKVHALKNQLLEINPLAIIHTHHRRINASNVKSSLSNFPIVVEAVDRAEVKAMLIENLLYNNADQNIVAGNGMAGTGNANDIKTKNVLKNLYVCGDAMSDYHEDLGLWSSRVMLCAAHQAHKVLELITQGGTYEG